MSSAKETQLEKHIFVVVSEDCTTRKCQKDVPHRQGRRNLKVCCYCTYVPVSVYSFKRRVCKQRKLSLWEEERVSFPVVKATVFINVMFSRMN